MPPTKGEMKSTIEDTSVGVRYGDRVTMSCIENHPAIVPPTRGKVQLAFEDAAKA